MRNLLDRYVTHRWDEVGVSVLSLYQLIVEVPFFLGLIDDFLEF